MTQFLLAISSLKTKLMAGHLTILAGYCHLPILESFLNLHFLLVSLDIYRLRDVVIAVGTTAVISIVLKQVISIVLGFLLHIC